MATCRLFRSLQGMALVRACNGPLIKRTVPTVAVIQKKYIQSSNVQRAREYGPPVEFISKTSHWRTERIVAASLIPIIPGALLYPSMATDMLLSAGLVLHSHWGLTGVISDYIHGPTLPKLLQSSVLVLSVIVFGALCYLNYNDCGLANACAMVFSRL